MVLKIYNETYELTYVDSEILFWTTEASDFKDRAIINYYMSDTMLAKFLSGDTKPIFVYNNMSDREKEGDFTEEEALKAAKAVMVELYGEDALEGYSRIALVDDQEPRQKYSIGFGRKILGYDTNDNVTVSFDMAGNFIGLNAHQYGILERAENDLTEEEIKNAVEYVEQTFVSDWNIGSYSIVLDVEGDYYIRAGVSRKNGEVIEAMQVYVNIR
jgi:hypothetical protein